MSIIIEEIVYNPLIQIDETIEEITISVSEMQMPGATGADGKSAYQSALDGGFVGTELEFNQFLSEVDQKLNISDYNDRFKGVFLTLEALNLALPTANAGDSAQVNEVGVTDVINYSWDAEENIWVQSGASGSGASNTDALPEGTSNLYFTTARVLSTFINGVSFLIGTPIVSTDTILQALGKLQKQITDALVSTNRQTVSYTLILTDINKLIETDIATANIVTIPLNSSVAFPIGTKIDVVQYGTGQTSFAATIGVTIRSANNWVKINARYGAATLTKIGIDEWYLWGNLNA